MLAKNNYYVQVQLIPLLNIMISLSNGKYPIYKVLDLLESGSGKDEYIALRNEFMNTIQDEDRLLCTRIYAHVTMTIIDMLTRAIPVDVETTSSLITRISWAGAVAHVFRPTDECILNHSELTEATYSVILNNIKDTLHQVQPLNNNAVLDLSWTKQYTV